MSGLDALLQRPEHESFWSRFCRSPTESVAQYVYGQGSTALRKKTTDDPVHVVCISDTHNTKPNLPDGDILVHAGDLTQSGTREELKKQIDWLDSQPHRYKIVIAGNHETFLDRNHHSYHGNEEGVTIDWKSLIYLENTSIILDLGAGRRLKVFGSPYTPQHGNGAFQYLRTDTTIWQELPKDIDILVTHGPPKAHLDLGHLGCWVLRQTLWEMEPRPLLHVFGHIHGGYGKEVVYWDPCQRAYEAIKDGESRWWNLCVLFCSWIPRLFFEQTAADRATVMVNAAAVGGVRDEKRREAICVDI